MKLLSMSTTLVAGISVKEEEDFKCRLGSIFEDL